MTDVGGLRSVIESCKRFLRRLWWSDLVLAGLVGALSQLGLFANCRWSANGWVLAGILAGVASMPHLLVRIGLGPSRIARLKEAPVDPQAFSPDRVRLRRIAARPFRVDVQLNQNITRADVEALSEDERRLVPVVQAAVTWNVLRLHAMAVLGAAMVLFLDTSSVGLGRELLIAAYVLLLATCFPRIAPWVSRAAAR